VRRRLSLQQHSGFRFITTGHWYSFSLVTFIVYPLHISLAVVLPCTSSLFGQEMVIKWKIRDHGLICSQTVVSTAKKQFKGIHRNFLYIESRIDSRVHGLYIFFKKLKFFRWNWLVRLYRSQRSRVRIFWYLCLHLSICEWECWSV
jgi:hypothetical protein